MGGHAAHCEATAVEIQQHRQRFCRGWGIQPSRQFEAIARGDQQVLHPGELVRRQIQHTCARCVGRFGLRGCERVHGRMPGASHAVEQAAHGGCEQGTGIRVVGH